MYNLLHLCRIYLSILNYSSKDKQKQDTLHSHLIIDLPIHLIDEMPKRRSGPFDGIP